MIGWLTHFVALGHAFVLLALLCVTTAVGARVLRTEPALVRRSEGAPADGTRELEMTGDTH